MNKVIILISILALSSISALAQSRSTRIDGSISIGNGDDIVRIDINNRSRGNRTLNQRVNRLERAVRQLQNRVYDLEDERNVPQALWTCKLTTWGTTYYGQSLPSKGAAEKSAHKKCESEENFNSNCSVNGNMVKMNCTQE